MSGHAANGCAAVVEGEHKQVTVLFCDVVGSTELADRLGPERMHAVLTAFFALAIAEVRRFQGTINQFLGDGFMALFGAPEPCENHARHAVLAALAVQRAVASHQAALALPAGEVLAVRTGINTGDVVVGTIGDELRRDFTAIGDTTNVAGRLQQQASPGTVLVGVRTAALVRDYVRLDPVGLLTVKGKALPVPAWRVLGVGSRRSRLDGVHASRLTAFVGRRRELAQLAEALGKAEAGRGQVIGIVGDAGAGKSRLLREFRSRIGGGAAAWLIGHCLPYGQAMPYLPVIEVLRKVCGLRDADPPSAAARKLRALIDRLGPQPDDTLPCLLNVLGIAGSGEGEVAESLAHSAPEAVKAKTFETLCQLTLAGSRQRALVIAIEDLHWVDGTSADYLAALVERIASARVLLLLTYRPESVPAWVRAGGVTEIALPQLSEGESLAMLQTLGQHPSSPVARTILDRASGNPLFLEELGRAARASDGLGDAEVPDTIEDVLAARIDRVADRPRRLLRAASVLGREISPRVLGAVWPEHDTVEEDLAELVRLELLAERAGGEERVLVFQHALVQEVAYAGLLERHRRAAHGAVARRIQALYAGRTVEVVDLLAHHFGRSDDDEAAVDHAILAGERAQSRWANAEALARFEAGLARLRAMPDSPANRLRRIDAVLAQAEVRFALGRHAEHVAALEDIRGLVETTPDPRRRAAWHYWAGFLGSLTGAPPATAIEACRRAIDIAEAEGFEDISAFAGCCLAQVETVAGRLDAAVEAGERALAAFEARGNRWWACRALWILSAAANAQGDWARSLAYCRRALDHGLAVDDLRLKVAAQLRMASTLIQQGDPAAGLARCDAAAALSPIPFDAAGHRAIRGYGLMRLGDAGEGAADLQAARAWCERSHLHYTHALFSLWLADAFIRLGNLYQAGQLLDPALGMCRALGYRHLEGVAHRLLAELGGPEAGDHIRIAIDRLTAAGARNELARALVLRARERARVGATAGARQDLRSALELFEALDTLHEPQAARAALATLEPAPTGEACGCR